MKFNNILKLIDKIRLTLIVGSVMLLLLTGCAKRTMVVLLPEPNGKVGKIEVANPQGDQLLSEAYQSTVVSHPGATPKEPVVLEKAAVEKEFEYALKMMPSIPETYTLFFELSTTTLKAYSLALIPEIVKKIADRQSTDVSIIGHTDRIGADEANRALSFDRARKVAELLISSGVDALILEIGYHGEGNPLIPTPDNVPEPKNRRVDVTIR